MTPQSEREQARREVLLVGLLTAVGAIVRFWQFGRLGLAHFDEGVYAAAGFWSVQPAGLAALDPQLIAYAPPGFPVLVGLAYRAFGVSDASALFVTLSCGVLTVPMAAWVARRTFGAGAGAAAAAFAALALAHVALSRKALTDVPFVLAWLLALGLGGRFLEVPRAGRAIAFGLAVGLAQEFKYNGWLAGAVIALAAMAGAAFDPEARRSAALARTFGLGLLAAFVAGLTYTPWYRFVENHGGYAALVRHHRSYLGGPGSWLPHAEQQLAQVIALSGGPVWGLASWAVAWLGAGIAVNSLRFAPSRSRADLTRFRLGLGLGALLLAGWPDLGWWVGLAWGVFLLADRRPSARVLAASWLLLSILTPFYHPYARLWLPLHAVGWVLLAGVMVSAGRFSVPGRVAWPSAWWRHPRLLARVALAAGSLLVGVGHWRPPVPQAYSLPAVFAPTDALRMAVFDLRPDTPGSPLPPSVALKVLARRPVAYYLALAGNVPIRLLPDRFAFLAGPRGSDDWILVDQVQFEQESGGDASWDRVLRKWAKETSWFVPLDPVTRLDYQPEEARDGPTAETPTLWLLAPPVLAPRAP